MQRPVPMIYSTSRRLPLKPGCIFDSGLAGGVLDDVTGLGYNASTDLSGYSRLLEGLKSADCPIFEAYAGRKLDGGHPHQMNSSGMHDPLSDIEIDWPANNSLEAFINLDQFLDVLFDGITDIDPGIAIPGIDKVTVSSSEQGFDPPKASPVTEAYMHRTTVDVVNVEHVKTNLFEVPSQENISPNHDSTTQYQRVLTPLEGRQKATTNSNRTGKLNIKSILSSNKSSTLSDNLESNLESTNKNKQVVIRTKVRTMSKISREQRRPKLSDLEVEALRLTEANEKLRQNITELEKITKEMKAQLIAKIAGS